MKVLYGANNRNDPTSTSRSRSMMRAGAAVSGRESTQLHAAMPLDGMGVLTRSRL